MTDQVELNLLGAKGTPRLDGTEAQVRVQVKDLPVGGLRAPIGLRESVRALGVVTPILAELDAEGKILRIIDGVRRVSAAQEVLDPDATVPVLPASASAGAVATLSLNWHRSRNIIAEAAAVQALVAAGHSPKSIAQALHVTPVSVNELLALNNLPPLLRDAFGAGTLNATTALAVARLPQADQLALQDRFTANKNKLHLADVRALRECAATAAADAMPAELFAVPERVAMVGVPEVLLRELLELAYTAPGLSAMEDAVLKRVEGLLPAPPAVPVIPEIVASEPPTCILTGEEGENADDCTTHPHEAAIIALEASAVPTVLLDEVILGDGPPVRIRTMAAVEEATP